MVVIQRQPALRHILTTLKQIAANRNGARVLSVLIALALWLLVAKLLKLTFLSDPITVMQKLVTDVFLSGEFFQQFGHTLRRVLVATAISFSLGVSLGLAMAKVRLIERYFEVYILIGLTVPGLIIAVLTLLVLGFGEFAAATSIILIVFPYLALNFWEGAKAEDRKLYEMARVYHLPRVSQLRNITLPQLYPFLFASLRMGFSFAWKVIVLVELLGLGSGVGYKIHWYYQMYEMPMVLAWVMAFLLVMFVLEYAVIRPVETRVLRWRQQP